MTDRGTLPYDHLILATGARHAYFGHDEWEAAAPGLKKIEDATELRRRILIAFELAETEDRRGRAHPPPDLRHRGRRRDRRRDGRRHRRAREEGARRRLPQHRSARCAHRSGRGRAALLPAFDPSLSDYAKRALEIARRRGHPQQGGHRRATTTGVALGDERIESRTVIWAAGVRASPAGKWLDVGDRPRRPRASSIRISRCPAIRTSSCSATPRS